MDEQRISERMRERISERINQDIYSACGRMELVQNEQTDSESETSILEEHIQHSEHEAHSEYTENAVEFIF